MPELQSLRSDHADRLLAFEVANRDYFASSVSDRGEEYFADFQRLHEAALAEQDAGECAYYLLVADDGQIMGRFNLYDLDGGTATLGYRVGERFAGRGVATSGVQKLCWLAARRFGLRSIRAATSHTNVASAKVLVKAGFVEIGPAEPAEIGGRSGTWYERVLV